MKLANAFGITDSIRTRNLEFAGHSFKVKIPTTAETEAMYERIKVVSNDDAEKRFQEMAGPFLENKDKYANDPDVKFKDDDVVVREYSLRETARNKQMTENRIVEMFRLLVPKEQDFEMSQIAYADIDEIFPFAVQLEMVEEISLLISPNYGETRKK